MFSIQLKLFLSGHHRICSKISHLSASIIMMSVIVVNIVC
jgi:hypothetical protein